MPFVDKLKLRLNISDTAEPSIPAHSCGPCEGLLTANTHDPALAGTGRLFCPSELHVKSPLTVALLGDTVHYLEASFLLSTSMMQAIGVNIHPDPALALSKLVEWTNSTAGNTTGSAVGSCQLATIMQATTIYASAAFPACPVAMQQLYACLAAEMKSGVHTTLQSSQSRIVLEALSKHRLIWLEDRATAGEGELAQPDPARALGTVSGHFYRCDEMY